MITVDCDKLCILIPKANIKKTVQSTQKHYVSQNRILKNIQVTHNNARKEKQGNEK